MRIVAIHGIDDLASDMAGIADNAQTQLAPVVQRSTEAGNKIAQDFARAASGPHGRLYYKRITSEMRSPLSGEYGPTGDVAGNAVGAGWRNHPENLDLAKSADVIGPAFAEAVGRTADGWFW